MGRRKPKTRPGPYLLHAELLRERIPSLDQFPYCLPVVRHLQTLPFHPKVPFLIGENGTGKSALLEALAVSRGLNPEGGSRNFNFATRSSHSRLDECLRLAKAPALPGDCYFLRAVPPGRGQMRGPPRTSPIAPHCRHPGSPRFPGARGGEFGERARTDGPRAAGPVRFRLAERNWRASRPPRPAPALIPTTGFPPAPDDRRHPFAGRNRRPDRPTTHLSHPPTR